MNLKPILLIITKYPGDYSSIIESNYSKYNIVWLQLWPVVKTKILLDKFPNLTIVKSIDFISNEDHFKIANEVNTISRNWWNLLKLNKYGKEWNIDGLKITQIFAYELEQVLTNIMFHILVVNRAIKDYSPKELLFIDKEDESYTSNEIFNKFINSSLLPYYQFNQENIKVKQAFNYSPQKKEKRKYLKNLHSKFRKTLSLSPRLIYLKLKYILVKQKLANNSVIISNSNRCLTKFDEFASKTKQVFILNNERYTDQKCNHNYLKDSIKDVFYEGVSLSPFFKIILPVIENKFFNLQEYYKKTVELSIRHNPALYITINMGEATELVKLWAFKQQGVRTILASEGANLQDERFDIVLNSLLHPEINIERWVNSFFYFEKHRKSITGIKVTGFLENNINKNYIIAKRKNINKKIVIALSAASLNVRRAINDEDMFEILQFVTDVAQVVSELSGVELIIKLKPADEDNIPLYKKSIGNGIDIKFNLSRNLNTVIYNSDLVIIYNTSVGIESLNMRKNVICYDYTNRPSYITSIFKYINQDPRKGAALLVAHNKEELKKAIKQLLPFSSNIKPSPNFEYLLENTREGYDVEKVVKELITAE